MFLPQQKNIKTEILSYLQDVKTADKEQAVLASEVPFMYFLLFLQMRMQNIGILGHLWQYINNIHSISGKGESVLSHKGIIYMAFPLSSK